MCRYAGVQEGAFDDIQQVSYLLQQGMIYCTLYIPDVHQIHCGSMVITTIIDSVTFSYIFGKGDSPLGINITGELTMLSARGAGVSVFLVPVIRLQFSIIFCF